MAETREELATRLIENLMTNEVEGQWYTVELELDGVWATKRLRRTCKPSENEVRSHFSALYEVGQIHIK